MKARKKTVNPNGAEKRQTDLNQTSELGRVLRRLAEKNVASGAKLLNRRELEREIAERRGIR